MVDDDLVVSSPAFNFIVNILILGIALYLPFAFDNKRNNEDF